MASKNVPETHGFMRFSRFISYIRVINYEKLRISTIHYGVEEYFKAEDDTLDENSIVIQKSRGKYDITYGLYGLSENYDDKRLSADSKSNLKVEIWKGFDKKEKELILKCVEEAEKNIDNIKSLFSY